METPNAHAMNTMLIPLDGSDAANRAIDFAVTIGGPTATYVLLHVLPPELDLRNVTGEVVLSTDRIQKMNRDVATTSLEAGSVLLRTAAPGASIETVTRTGDPALSIVKEARHRGADFIVMASQGRESSSEASFGSTADRVVRTSTIPVLVVRARAGDVLGPRITRIVVPLDGSRRAAQAVPVAGRLAQRLGVAVRIITVIDPTRSFPRSMSYEAAQSGAFFEEILSGMRYELQCVQDEAEKIVRNTGVDVDSVLLYGKTVPEIIDATAPGDLIVMTSHGLGVGKHWMLGSVSEKLLREARLPIALLRSQPEPDVVVYGLDSTLGLEPMGHGRR